MITVMLYEQLQECLLSLLRIRYSYSCRHMRVLLITYHYVSLFQWRICIRIAVTNFNLY
jgi:hypothetical protein